MKAKWIPITIVFAFLAIFGVSLLWWMVPKKTEPAPEIGERSEVPLAETTQRASLETFTPVFKGLDLPTPEEVLQADPDVHPSVTMFHSMFPDKSVFDTPELQRFLRAYTSPEYTELMNSSPTREEWDAFWEKHTGVKQDPDRFDKSFREYFPEGEPEDYEPEMRAVYLELLEDLDISPDQILENLWTLTENFLADPRREAWEAGYFQGRTGFQGYGYGNWTGEILREWERTARQSVSPESSVGAPEPAAEVSMGSSINREASTEVLQPGASEQDARAGAAASESVGDAVSSEPPLPVVIEDLADLLPAELPTDATFEARLRESLDPERFSPQRLNTALQTLNQYGPTEGLRRLKASDPEVATRLERVLQLPAESQGSRPKQR